MVHVEVMVIDSTVHGAQESTRNSVGTVFEREVLRQRVEEMDRVLVERTHPSKLVDRE